MHPGDVASTEIPLYCWRNLQQHIDVYIDALVQPIKGFDWVCHSLAIPRNKLVNKELLVIIRNLPHPLAS
jgi:hypothetical protein